MGEKKQEARGVRPQLLSEWIVGGERLEESHYWESCFVCDGYEMKCAVCVNRKGQGKQVIGHNTE